MQNYSRNTGICRSEIDTDPLSGMSPWNWNVRDTCPITGPETLPLFNRLAPKSEAVGLYDFKLVDDLKQLKKQFETHSSITQ